MKNIVLTTLDIKQNYEICGLVDCIISENAKDGEFIKNFSEVYPEYFVSNGEKGIFSKGDKYKLYDKAYRICCRELKRKADLLCGDAVIGVKFDIVPAAYGDNGSFWVYHMYGTAVKFV